MISHILTFLDFLPKRIPYQWNGYDFSWLLRTDSTDDLHTGLTSKRNDSPMGQLSDITLPLHHSNNSNHNEAQFVWLEGPHLKLFWDIEKIILGIRSQILTSHDHSGSYFDLSGLFRTVHDFFKKWQFIRTDPDWMNPAITSNSTKINESYSVKDQYRSMHVKSRTILTYTNLRPRHAK